VHRDRCQAEAGAGGGLLVPLSQRLGRAIFHLRSEEFLALVFFVPMAYSLAQMAGAQRGVAVGPEAVYPGALARLLALVGATILFLWLVRAKPQWRFARDVMPFVFCANIYVNLHDLIRYFGAPDITSALYRWDVRLFGFEPTIWAERFVHPFLTDYFTICYWLFYALGPLLGLLLYLGRDRVAFRYTVLSVVLCLYLGYIGYVAFPASAPRLMIAGAYSVALHGSPLLDFTRDAVAAIPLTAHGAFPSLHCAVALLALMLAWRHLRWFFWIQLPFAAGLIVGTIYLRHHWIVDILAGFGLTFFSFWLGPRLERWWTRMALRHAGSMECAGLAPGAVVESIPAGRLKWGG